jgi:hypothetical protein
MIMPVEVTMLGSDISLQNANINLVTSSLDWKVISLVYYCHGFKLCPLNMWLAMLMKMV